MKRKRRQCARCGVNQTLPSDVHLSPSSPLRCFHLIIPFRSLASQPAANLRKWGDKLLPRTIFIVLSCTSANARLSCRRPAERQFLAVQTLCRAPADGRSPGVGLRQTGRRTGGERFTREEGAAVICHAFPADWQCTGLCRKRRICYNKTAPDGGEGFKHITQKKEESTRCTYS